MPFTTPHFWYRKRNHPAPWQEIALRPFSALYALGHKINQATKTPTKASAPVLCVGNAVAGGSGKTPVSIALCKLLKSNNLSQTPVFLTRGYGGTLKTPTRVTNNHTSKEAGDESLLLAQSAPVIVSCNRIEGAKLAIQSENADLLIMDDGLQNKSIHKDISVMVIDGASAFGNKQLLPAGPLREPLEKALSKSNAFIIIGKDTRNVAAQLPENKPLFFAHVEARIPESLNLQAPQVAFSGLGRPEKFYHLLQHLNTNIAGWHSFPDHHAYTDPDLEKLTKDAHKKGASLLTTEKDYMRLQHHTLDIPLQTLPIEIVFEEESAVVDFLRQALKINR